MMRAKMRVSGVTSHSETSEELHFNAVAANGYPADGSDENNNYAKWTPSADLRMSITNPALIGKFTVGQEFYVDFTPVLVSGDFTSGKRAIRVTMGNLVYLNNLTRIDLPPDRVLQAAMGQLKSVVILGYDEDGNEYLASSIADGGTVLWLMERCKKIMLQDTGSW